ncbi:MAG: PpiC-type peptidyl-prolyl cis-trans isomerase [Myxococcales bacterium]|nr:PpiC-type peptidyl-prolyl cis-trans isomerase [Myxococcales bacterium]
MVVRKLQLLIVAGLTLGAPTFAMAAPDDAAKAPTTTTPPAAPTAPTTPTKPATAAPTTSPNAGKKIIFERVVAVINDAIVLRSELEARMIPVLGEAQQIADPKERDRRIEKLRSQVLDEMVNEELIVQAAEAAKIEVESSEVQAALDEIKSTNNLDDAALAQVLAAQGYTVANYKQDLRRQLLRLRAVNQLVAHKVNITDEDIRAKYDQMQRRSDSVSAVKLSHILFKLPEHPTEQQIAEAKDKAAKAMDRIKGGEDFAKVAADVSDDVSTKATGGELGYFQRGSMANPEWEPIVFAMEKGDIRGPVTGPQGLHVFNVTEVQTSNLKPFPEMKEQLSRELRRKEMDKQTQVWLEELRKKAYIDIKLS